MDIAIILPYKENFSREYAGAVSLFVNDMCNNSLYKKNIKILGSTNYKKILSKSYINIKFKKNFFKSTNLEYVKSIVKNYEIKKYDLIELHNRPLYVTYLRNLNFTKNIIFYFHNDPLSMNGSKTLDSRKYLVKNCNFILFNSNWSKKRFLDNLNLSSSEIKKLKVVYQSSEKPKNIDFTKKRKIITFVGKLNKAKGYDLFGKATIKILNKHKDWKANIVGDEPREKINFSHNRFIKHGFLEYKKTQNILKKTSISVICSRWNEPLGRSSLESSANGCAVIISNRGGLRETITNGVILKNLSINELYEKINYLIINNKIRKKFQKLSYKNFYLTNLYVSNLLDNIRKEILFKSNIFNINKNKLRILNIYNIGQKANHRIYNISIGKKFTNGFIRNNHDVIEISDRDFVRQNRKFGISNTAKFDEYLLETFKNYNPDLVFFGHSENIHRKTLQNLKEINKKILISQWNEDPMMQGLEDSKDNIKKLKKFEDLVDMSFITTSPDVIKKKHNIKNLSFFFIPVDRNIECFNVYNMKPKNDLFYAMSHGVNRGTLKRGKFDNRIKFLNKLTTYLEGIDYDFYGYENVEPVWADKFYKALIECKMGLNLSRGEPTKYYTSNRIASLIGNGLLTFIDRKTEIDRIFNKNEVIFYNSIPDLADKIRFYKTNEKSRINIAKKGQKKYFKLFNEKNTSEYLVKKILGKNISLFY